MFALNVTITSEVISTLKLDLNRRLPGVKSSHRCEALARALGFPKYASLLARFEADGSEQNCPVDGSAFAAYLGTHGFMVDEQPLLDAAAQAILQRIVRTHAQLGVWGFGAGSWQNGPGGVEETTQQRRARFIGERQALASNNSIKPFLTSMAMLSLVPKTASVRPKAWSYWLKHIAENMTTHYPDGQTLGPAYVPNGVFIAAAIASGFDCRMRHGSDGMLDRNCTFNMPYRLLAELDIEARPHGARAEARNRKIEEREFLARLRSQAFTARVP